MNLTNSAAIYFTKPEFIKELCAELGSVTAVIGNAIFSPILKETCFALDVWVAPQFVPIASINNAVQYLRSQGRNWYVHPLNCIRRSQLIAGQLPKVKLPPLTFPFTAALPALGAFSLLDNNLLVLSRQRRNPWPQGEWGFIEDKVNPPNRAYLKLWEALTLLQKLPSPNDTVLDLGASPGGWTYVMQNLGAQVTAVDKAFLDKRISALPGVRFLQQSAFALEPRTYPEKFDWVLADIACYPQRTLALIKRWLAENTKTQFIFTIKLQGETDLAILQEFQKIEKSSVRHLYHNKHEVTFFYPGLPETSQGL